MKNTHTILLSERTFIIHARRNIHKRTIRCRPVWRRTRLNIRILFLLRSAFRKLLFLDHDLSCVNFHAVFVGVTSSLNTTGNGNTQSLTEILFRELCQFTESNTRNEIRCRFSVSGKLSVYRKRVIRYRRRFISLRISNFGVSCEPSD